MNAGKLQLTNGYEVNLDQVAQFLAAIERDGRARIPIASLGNAIGVSYRQAENIGSITHALEIEGKGVEEETKDLDAGQSAELKVTLKPGKYEIYCPVDGHRQQGMEGTVTVKQGSGGGSGGY